MASSSSARLRTRSAAGQLSEWHGAEASWSVPALPAAEPEVSGPFRRFRQTDLCSAEADPLLVGIKTVTLVSLPVFGCARATGLPLIWKRARISDERCIERTPESAAACRIMTYVFIHVN